LLLVLSSGRASVSYLVAGLAVTHSSAMNLVNLLQHVLAGQHNFLLLVGLEVSRHIVSDWGDGMSYC